MSMADDYLKRGSGQSMADRYLIDNPPSGFTQGLGQARDAVMYNLNKIGAGITGGLANINEFIGLDSGYYREGQKYYQDNAKEYAQPDRPFLQEAYNPINYAVGGGPKMLLSTILGSSYANEAANSATTGEGFDVGRANTQAAVGLGVSSAFPAAGQAVNSIKNKIVGPTGNTADEIAVLQALAHKHGIELTPATTSGSPSLARMEHNLGDSAAGGVGLRQTVNTETIGTEGAITDAFNKMGATNSNVNAGAVFAQDTRELVDTEKQYFSDAFNKLFANYGDRPVFSIIGVQREANNFIALAERNPIMKNTAAYKDAQAIANTDSLLSWSDWSKLRTHLGSLVKDTTAADPYKQMYAQLGNDLQATVSVMDPLSNQGILKQYNKLMGEYDSFKEGFDGPGSGARFINSILRGEQAPETIGNSINNATQKAKRALTAGGFDPFTELPSAKKVSATDALLASRTPDNTGIDMSKFIDTTNREGFKEIANAPDRAITLKGVLEPSKAPLQDVKPIRKSSLIDDTVGRDAAIMEELRTIASAIVKKNSYKTNAKTASYNKINWLKANPASAVLLFAKDVAVSAAYRSDVFKRWLSKGYISRSQYQAGMNAINKGGLNKKTATVNILFNAGNHKKSTTQKLGL